MKLRIKGKPQPQGRPRATSINGKVRLYDPKTSKDYKETVATVAKAHMKKHKLKPISAPVKVRIDLYFTPPKSYTKKRLQEIEDGTYLFTKKPDVDNCSKAITDALNKIAYYDDAQIVEMTVTKQYGTEDCAEIDIQPVKRLG